MSNWLFQLINSLFYLFIGFLLSLLPSLLLEWIKKAKLEIMEEPFLFSKRIVLKVKHIDGSLPAINAVCYLDVSANKPLREFLVPKEGGLYVSSYMQIMFRKILFNTTIREN